MAAVTHEVSTAATAVGPLTSGAFTPAAGDLLVAFVMASGTVDVAPSLTSSVAGQSFSLITFRRSATSVDSIWFFVGNQLVTATSQTVTITFPNDNSTGQVIEVASVSGMSQFGFEAVRQFNGTDNGAAAATPAPVFSMAVRSENPCVGGIINASNPAGMTAPSGWAEKDDTGYTVPTTGAEYVSIDSGFTGTTVTWGSTSATVFGAIIVELDSSVWIKERQRSLPVVYLRKNK